MSKHTVMAWNERHILVEHVLVDRATDDCDPVMSAVHRLQRALGAKDGDRERRVPPSIERLLQRLERAINARESGGAQ